MVCIGKLRLIWHITLFLIIWRLIHNVIATEDNLIKRGSTIISRCIFSGRDYETVIHMFIKCPFIMKNWNWLASFPGIPLDLSTFYTLFALATTARSLNFFFLFFFCWIPQLFTWSYYCSYCEYFVFFFWKCQIKDIFLNLSHDLIFVKSLCSSNMRSFQRSHVLF